MSNLEKDKTLKIKNYTYIDLSSFINSKKNYEDVFVRI